MTPTEPAEVGAYSRREVDDKTEQALRDAKAYAENAENIKRGIIDVGAVPLRTSRTGARIEWDGVNGFVQYDQSGNPVNWFNLDGELYATNGYFTGTVNAKAGYFGDNLSLVNGKLRITRPDGAVWMQDGVVRQDYNISGFDPRMTDLLSFVNNPGYKSSAIKSFEDVFYESANAEFIDGRSSDHNDIRDSSYGYTFRYQRYEFIHSARYIVFGYRVVNNSAVGQHRIRAYSGSTLLGELICDRYSGYAPLTIDLGTPTYDRITIDIRLGWNRAWMDRDQYLRFRFNRVYLTDFL